MFLCCARQYSMVTDGADCLYLNPSSATCWLYDFGWASNLTSLCLSFLNCKMRIITVATS